MIDFKKWDKLREKGYGYEMKILIDINEKDIEKKIEDQKCQQDS